jgi:hypothetical protein
MLTYADLEQVSLDTYLSQKELDAHLSSSAPLRAGVTLSVELVVFTDNTDTRYCHASRNMCVCVCVCVCACVCYVYIHIYILDVLPLLVQTYKC